jgi:signal peptidase I
VTRPRLMRLARELGLLLLVAAAALAIRAWLVGLYAVPSASMMPHLLPGDYVIAAKYPFAVQGAQPARGDVVVFRATAADQPTFVKRVIGLPGDTVAVDAGRLVLNGRPLPRWRVADLLQIETPATPCRPDPQSRARREQQPDGRMACRYPRYRELLPDGAMIDVLDLGRTTGDAFGPVRVPAGRLFLLGDNGDNSADSRFAPGPEGGIGLVPVEDMLGRAEVILFSVDGSARWSRPGTWLSAVRWRRIGTRF